MSAKTAQVLRDAASELEVKGWCQNTLHQGESSCLIGAMRRAVGLTGNEYSVVSDLYEAFEAVSNSIHMHPATWNDKPGRTQAEVVKLLLTVADVAEVQT